MSRLPLIREIVKQAINTGYLTLKAEEQLRKSLKSKYEIEDFDAFIKLQQAVIVGAVTQESRELMLSGSC